ncbi:hypothetical protein [Aeromicrobium wangtongii]|uniref:DUF559 domain-containing protein n=1 Tax=Aeromicrobium wangtongii TaxID=2969247 RepID=A0ABY5M7U9_9ACTN|nr:hypothetical protein [Aeromicrobium wangtongii]MCD9199559.1 hypothetical protein [Aeromicrobium wangtongii]UUP13912.1 hypothetical protein NQV15_00965 [Aeromicrobium wangtongii]
MIAPAYLSVDPTAARISVAIALMGPANALGGWAALRVQGNTWFDGLDRSGDDRDVLIHCLPGSQLRVRPGIEPSEGRVHPDETLARGSFAVTTLARAAYDEMRVAVGVREAVVVLDMATSTTSGMPHTTLDAVAAVVESHHKTRGIAQARQALAMSSPRSASPWETRTRLLAELDVGLSGLLVNVPVFDVSGALLGVADLIDPATGLVIESDGAHHRAAEQHTLDNVREERFERAGLVVCRVTSLDHQDRWATVGRLASAHRDAARSLRRDWTLVQPDWWRTWPAARRWA